MKTTKTLTKRAALIAVLVLGSTPWLSAQQTNQGQYGQPGSGLDRQQNRYGTNSQYNQGRIGQPAGQNRQDNYGATGTNSQYNQGRSGQAGSGLGGQQNTYGSTNSQYNQGRSGQSGYGANNTNSQYNQGRSGQAGSGLDGQQNTYGTNSQYHQGQSGQRGYGANDTNSQYNQGRSGLAGGGLGRQQDNDDASDSTSLQVTKINKGSAIIGATVKNQQGESLGKIRDLVIDFNSGQVAYIVLDSETGLFNAAKLHAVPLQAFQPDAEGTSLILKTDKAQLDSSEGFAKDSWPGTAAATWGAEPSWKDRQGSSKSPEAYDADQQHTNDLKDKTYKDTTLEPKRSQPRP